MRTLTPLEKKLQDKYPWADNMTKLQRAIQQAIKFETPDDKAMIKKLYISYAGLVRSVPEKDILDDDDADIVEIEPKKAGRPKKLPVNE